MKNNNPYCRTCNENCSSGLCFKNHNNTQTAKQNFRNAVVVVGPDIESDENIIEINIIFDFHLTGLNSCNENSNYFSLR
jgi:hypothetical protein